MSELMMSEYAFGRFTPMLLALVAGAFLISRPTRTKASTLLSVYLLLVALFHCSYFVAYSVYSPLGSLGWYLATVGPFGIACLVQFAYHFPVARFQRESRLVLVLSMILALLGVLEYAVIAPTHPTVATVHHHGSAYAAKIMPNACVLLYVWAIAVFVRQAVHSSREAGADTRSALRHLLAPANRNGRAARLFAVLVLLELLNTVSIALFLNLQLFSFSTINVTSNSAFLVIIFLYVVLYINNAAENISFMYRLVGITLVTVMLVTGTVGHLAFQAQQEAYDQKNRALLQQMMRDMETGQTQPMDTVQYILVGGNGTPWRWHFAKPGLPSPEPIRFWERAPSIGKLMRTDLAADGLFDNGVVKTNRFVAQLGDRLFYHYATMHAGSTIGIGFNLVDARRDVHDIAVTLVGLVVLVTLLIVVLFPYLFYIGLVSPLNRLLGGVRQAEQGDLDTQVSVQFADEIGFLTAAFNRMILAIRQDRLALQDYANNLEGKVEARTHELTLANQELQKARDELWGEMELAKKIQTLLLPNQPEIAGYELAAIMRAAAEVGGDYYDVIRVDGRDWFVIGDAAGHGVVAGLMMMMVQTSIQTVLHQDSTLQPHQLLNTINRALSRNLRRLGGDRYMTLTVFASHQDGEICFAGLHLDILVYRRASARVEQVPTDGCWIGVLDDVCDLNPDHTLHLHSGDVMLLFTDGVTEARSKPRMEKDSFFGTRRLVEVLTGLCNTHSSVEEIKEGILASLADFDTPDDLTLLIAKRV